MFKKRGQGQSWSMDIILAFVVFVLIIGIFYALLSNNKKDKTSDLTLESRTVISNLDLANVQEGGTPLTIINKGNIESSRLEGLYTADYMSIKRQLGIKGDFCIYVVDQYGNLITVDDGTGHDIGSFGNDSCTVNDNPCGMAFP
jgi:hypothetical protein